MVVGWQTGLGGGMLAAMASILSIWPCCYWPAPARAKPHCMSAEKTAQYLRERAGILFDPHMTPAFLQTMTELGELPAKA